MTRQTGRSWRLRLMTTKLRFWAQNSIKMLRSIVQLNLCTLLIPSMGVHALGPFTGIYGCCMIVSMFYECFWHSINISFHMAPICSRSQWQLPALPKEHAWSRWRGCSLSWHDLCLDWLVAYAARRHQTPINQGRHGSNRILLDSILLDLTFSYITVWYVLLWPACDCECPVTGFC